MKIIFGLGNPGSKYENNYHNLGFMAIDAIAQKTGITLNKKGRSGVYGEGNINGEKVFLVKPETYMNNSGECVSAFMAFYKCPIEDIMVMYDDIFTDYGKEKVRMVFADLADPDNYPIYLHCTHGCDRTGTICYLLEALLGVSRGDCLKDYGLSNLNIAYIQTVENGLKAYEGDTLKEQVESYLLSCGVSEYQMETIRNIFLED